MQKLEWKKFQTIGTKQFKSGLKDFLAGNYPKAAHKKVAHKKMEMKRIYTVLTLSEGEDIQRGLQ